MNKVIEQLQEWPRGEFVREPTPLLQAHNLAGLLGRQPSNVLVKMDSETSFGLGGNKARKLEFELAPSRLIGKTCIITCGGVQSNHARLTAAAAARLGLRCILVLNSDTPAPLTGNSYLHKIFGAEIRLVKNREERNPEMTRAAEEVQASGGEALVIPLGASTPLGTLGYVRAAAEIMSQWRVLPVTEKTWIFVSASSCGTYAGLALGFALLGCTDVRLVGVSPDINTEEIIHLTKNLYSSAAKILGTPISLPSNLILTTADYIGPGYGIPTEASNEATLLLARTEGILLDPVYTAKTAAAMLDWARAKKVPIGDRLVLWHTGGYPAALTSNLELSIDP